MLGGIYFGGAYFGGGSLALGQTIRPDGSVSAGAWTTGSASLHAALSDSSDATLITGVAS